MIATAAVCEGSNSATHSKAALVSLTLLYESCLPCNCRAVATPGRSSPSTPPPARASTRSGSLWRRRPSRCEIRARARARACCLAPILAAQYTHTHTHSRARAQHTQHDTRVSARRSGAKSAAATAGFSQPAAPHNSAALSPDPAEQTLTRQTRTQLKIDTTRCWPRPRQPARLTP